MSLLMENKPLNSSAMKCPMQSALDLRMPGIDGIDVLQRVKAAYPKVQDIILTGKGSKKNEKEAKRLGAYDYLEKPVEVDTLVDKFGAPIKTVSKIR